MTNAPVQQIDLAKAFKTASQVLMENKTALNEADAMNHDHGDNMVQIFNTISRAVGRQKNASAGDQLEYAAQVLRQKTASGSSQLYADGLQNAAAQFKGRAVTEKNGMELIQALMGMNTQAAPASQNTGSMDGLGSLLGGLMGGEGAQQSQGAAPGMDLLGALLGGGNAPQQQPQQASQSAPGMDLLGALLGGGNAPQQQPQQQTSPSGGAMDLLGSLLGGGAASQNTQNQGGMNIAHLLQLGLGYFQATQAGATPLQAIMQVLLNSGSPMAGREYRAQSGALVMQALMQAFSGAAAK